MTIQEMIDSGERMSKPNFHAYINEYNKYGLTDYDQKLNDRSMINFVFFISMTNFELDTRSYLNCNHCWGIMRNMLIEIIGICEHDTLVCKVISVS